MKTAPFLLLLVIAFYQVSGTLLVGRIVGGGGTQASKSGYGPDIRQVGKNSDRVIHV